jgi:hypothetical protein
VSANRDFTRFCIGHKDAEIGMGVTILIAEELSAYMVISAYCECHAVEKRKRKVGRLVFTSFVALCDFNNLTILLFIFGHCSVGKIFWLEILSLR